MIKIERIDKKKFNPFRMTIDVETLEDAENLFARLNMAVYHCNKETKTYEYYKPLANSHIFHSTLFMMIQNELESQG